MENKTAKCTKWVQTDCWGGFCTLICPWALWSNQDFLRTRQELVQKTLVTFGRGMGLVWRCSCAELSINIQVKRVVRWTQCVSDRQHGSPRGACEAPKKFGTFNATDGKTAGSHERALCDCSETGWFLLFTSSGLVRELMWAVSFWH